jgi:phosphatidylserine/phosphatidylglycerophosphate/cardiolipin synthase-like enzyme
MIQFRIGFLIASILPAARLLLCITFLVLGGYTSLQAKQAPPPVVGLSLDHNPAAVTSDVIAMAEQSIAALVYKFDNEKILQAIEKAVARGVTVRLLVDGSEAKRKRSQAGDAKKAGAEVRRWKSKKGKLHAKCLIIDGSRVLTGSFNWTDSASESNVELLLFSDDAPVAQEFQKIFERLWEEGKPLKN